MQKLRMYLKYLTNSSTKLVNKSQGDDKFETDYSLVDHIMFFFKS